MRGRRAVRRYARAGDTRGACIIIMQHLAHRLAKLLTRRLLRIVRNAEMEED